MMLLVHAGVANAQTRARIDPREALALPGITTLQRGSGAPSVTIVEFSDFECPFCATLAPMLVRLVDQHPDQIRLVFKHNPLPIHPNAPLAHEAALAAGVQGKFWEMHDLLFANQKRLSRFDLINYARQLQLDVNEFTAALTDHRFKALVDQDLIESRGFGVEATPTFFVNGVRHVGAPSASDLEGFVKEALDASAPAKTTEEARVEHIDETGAPVRGAAGAPVTIVEFSDLQCPYCARVLPTVQQLMTAYPGKIRWVFKHFPLRIHPDATVAHRAAIAAAEQGKFWEMHDALFANQRAVTRDELVATARRLNLDVARFIKDLDDERPKAKIDRDLKEAKALGLSGTPTFFINGRRLVGARPFASFQELIDEELGVGTKAGAAEPPALRDTAAANDLPAREPKEVREESEPNVTRGEKNAPVTLLWFSDFRSGLTPRASDLVKQVTAAYPGRIRVIVRHRPIETRPDGRLIHEAAVAAAAQGRFWQMHDAIVAEPAGTLDRDRLIAIAARVGVDRARFVSDLDSGVYRATVERDLEDARRRDVRGTPVFFVNGHRIDGIQPLEMFTRVVEDELRKTAEK